MRPWLAVLITIVLFVASVFISRLINFDVTLIMIVLTALWAAIDSAKLGLKRYISGISYGPVVLFIGVAMLWIVGFPWYLVVRHKIKTGAAVLKHGGRADAT